MKLSDNSSADRDLAAKDKNIVARPLVDESGRVASPNTQQTDKPHRRVPKG